MCKFPNNQIDKRKEYDGCLGFVLWRDELVVEWMCLKATEQ